MKKEELEEDILRQNKAALTRADEALAAGRKSLEYKNKNQSLIKIKMKKGPVKLSKKGDKRIKEKD